MDGSAATILSLYVQRKTAYLISHNWNIRMVAVVTLLGQPFTTVSFLLTRRAKWLLRRIHVAIPLVQTVWTAVGRSIACMAQYSENTSHDNGCCRYAEVGCAYTDSSNECGLSAQYARFNQGTERSVELTWRRQINKTIALQPSFQYVNNDNGDFAVLCARMSVSF